MLIIFESFDHETRKTVIIIDLQMTAVHNAFDDDKHKTILITNDISVSLFLSLFLSASESFQNIQKEDTFIRTHCVIIDGQIVTSQLANVKYSSAHAVRPSVSSVML